MPPPPKSETQVHKKVEDVIPTLSPDSIRVIPLGGVEEIGKNMTAVEYGNDTAVRAIMQVTYTDDFIVLESVNHKSPPIALVRGKDHFRIIGRVIERHQKLA